MVCYFIRFLKLVQGLGGKNSVILDEAEFFPSKYKLGGIRCRCAAQNHNNKNRKEHVMSRSSGVLKMMGYPFGAAVAASLIVLLIGVCVFGFQFTEWEGRFVGVVGTIAGIAGAVVGLLLASRAEQRGVK